jgi:hypothetical protein
MTKKLSIAGFLVTAAASSAFVFSPAPSKAACLSTSSVTTCATFDNTGSAFQGVNDKAYTDTQFVANNQLDQIKFTHNGGFTAGLPIILNDIEYFNGTTWTTAGLSATTYNVTSTSALLATNLLTSSQTFNQSLFQLRYTIAANPSLTGVTGAAFESFARNSNSGATIQSQTRTHELVVTPPTGTPSPLPIFGASAAFGFSRRLRKQIKSFA